ncbi:MAG: response regulator transcription factor [Lentisphaeraceae bacterium]|nr:response regulator transcription factor [Lentisphaeraceae bacterium]
MSNKILMVEDNEKLAKTLCEGLKENGFAVEYTLRGDSGLGRIITENFDLVILDVLLPGIDGYKIVEKLRALNNNTPILMLTAMGTNENILNGFTKGVDDYLTKPFDFQILLARVKAILKRSSQTNELNSFGELKIDLGNNIVYREDVKIELTPREFTLFRYMLLNEGKTLSRLELMNNAWGSKSSDTNQIDVYIKYLRTKIDDPFEKKIIQTVRGLGYSISLDSVTGQ